MARKPSRFWSVEFLPEAARWQAGLSRGDANQLASAVRQLRQEGPTLGEPYVKRITGSRHHNMKELRPLSGNVRALFAFDPRRRAVVLVGGDKTGQWNKWYPRHIRIADQRLDQHLRSLGREESWQRNTAHATGKASRSRSR